ncbi:DNA repair protein RecN [Bacteroides graminisolvens]|uniref:DNA repair protein RecN n=1 Tax=Bacteroides graminisolvens TaxID=477666 RepID=UPI0023F5470E|nr:DNA repair protein RecN [Bacteroides graminisolvens]
MLQSLFIQNYALIEKLDIRFMSGFSVITGETGAGKSIILGAIGLLLGQRADVKSLRTGASKCIIEARFDVSAYGMQPFFAHHELEYEPECILRREVYASGKSRAFINDTPASLSQMKELGEQLIDVHSQHQNLLLNQEGFQLNFIDILAHNDHLLSQYRECYQAWKQHTRRLQELIEQAAQSKADEEFVRFQLQQLDEAALQADEQEELEQEAETLSHAEEIKGALYKAEQLLLGDEGGLLSALKEGYTSLRSVSRYHASLQELAQRAESSYIELKDIAQELALQNEKVGFNPVRLDEVNTRLNLLYTLQQKHRVSTVGELMALADEFRNRLTSITSLDEEIATLTESCNTLRQEVIRFAGELTESRRPVAAAAEQEMASRLALLGMPNVRFRVELGQRKEVGPSGQDTVTFLFSANKNGQLQNITSVASGGEIARVMLSVKAMIAGAVQLPTIVFDEIDTGVSGEIADRMADIMHEMGAANRQVISITHLPQIAARGAAHYKVYKEDNDTETNSHIRLLTAEERVEELAHMLSGATLTEAALNNARALLQLQPTKNKKKNG